MAWKKKKIDHKQQHAQNLNNIVDFYVLFFKEKNLKLVIKIKRNKKICEGGKGRILIA